MTCLEWMKQFDAEWNRQRAEEHEEMRRAWLAAKGDPEIDEQMRKLRKRYAICRRLGLKSV
jgi:hypothetical protein